jgi:predicted ATPase
MFNWTFPSQSATLCSRAKSDASAAGNLDRVTAVTKLKTSWTKYDIAQVMEVISDVDTIEKFKNREAGINEAILRSFLGIRSLQDTIPKYWIVIQNYPNEKKLFALFATIFTHGEIVNEFASKYSTGDMRGVFKTEPGKQYTNIRSALIESGAAKPVYRRTYEVPYDFTPIFQNPSVGKLFKLVLLERLSRFTDVDIGDEDFFKICFSNNFHKALSVSEDQFKSWLQGADTADSKRSFIEKVNILNFFSVEEVVLDFKRAREIYFLGENGDGKSLILMAIYLAFNGNFITERTDQEKTGKAADILRNNKNILLTGFDDRGKEYNLQKGVFLDNFFAYGTHRGRYSTDKPEEYGFMSLFDSEQTLLNPVSWLKDQKLFELEQRLDANNEFGKTKELLNLSSVELLEEMFYELLEKNVEIKVEGSGVTFKEKGTYLTFDQLSEGYKSIIIFVSDLLYRLNKNAGGGKKTTDLKGVVLLDEIDLHLHPKWQRIIIGKLRKLFPNVQFISTTHSPTIIQGASEDAIMFRVYRNQEDGKTRVSDPYYRKDIHHLMINTLLTSPLFGLSDARMNSANNDSDTSETYLLYRVNKKLEEELERQKKAGKEFISDQAIDDLIQKLIKDELGNK